MKKQILSLLVMLLVAQVTACAEAAEPEITGPAFVLFYTDN